MARRTAQGRAMMIAVVTGGASGIGAACARMLAARGHRVVVADRDGPRAAALAREIGGIAITLDVATQAANEAAAAEIETTLGPVEILVTSAGVIQRPLRAEDLPEEEVRRVIDIDAGQNRTIRVDPIDRI
jgi:NAD(P)-dependent dehydrogenase (short-subunit alcohol dehydrogenase family)